MEKWPKHLPNPSTSFNVTATPNTSRTSMSSGHVRQRALTKRTSYSASVTFEIDDGGFEAFKAFLAYNVNNGNDWFECPLATGGGVVNRLIRIIGGKYKANYVNYMNWRLTMSVDVKEVGVIDQDFWNLINSSEAPEEGWYNLLNALAICVNKRN